jgi:hypothetical protein
MRPNDLEIITDEREGYVITEDDVRHWTNGTFQSHVYSWFAKVLNGEQSAEEAREDCIGILFSEKWGNRTPKEDTKS